MEEEEAPAEPPHRAPLAWLGGDEEAVALQRDGAEDPLQHGGAPPLGWLNASSLRAC